MNFLLETLRLGFTNLRLHKLRSLLTAMGIIFGVAAVIWMVAIGEGNKQKATKDIEDLGATNIILRSRKPPESNTSGQATTRMITYGIRRLDVRRIEQTVGKVKQIVPLKRVGSRAVRGRYQVSAETFGTTPELIEVASLSVPREGHGRYLQQEDLDRLANVAVLGAEVAERLFPLEDPLNGEVMIDGQIFKVIGVLNRVGLAGGSGSALVGRDLNYDIHIPLTTAQSRFGDTIVRRSAGSMEREQVELYEVYVNAGTPDDVVDVAEQVKLVIDAAHAKDGDVSIIVPLELLHQRQRALRMFNTLMIFIAAISLLVGGIGIMNIMLASVTERTREIGIRRALGATRKHIAAQFLVETTILSSAGGLVGVALGLIGVPLLAMLPKLDENAFSDMGTPIPTDWSIIAGFVVATGVGIIFGFYPAVQAAKQDPIVALRHD